MQDISSRTSKKLATHFPQWENLGSALHYILLNMLTGEIESYRYKIALSAIAVYHHSILQNQPLVGHEY